MGQDLLMHEFCGSMITIAVLFLICVAWFFIIPVYNKLKVAKVVDKGFNKLGKWLESKENKWTFAQTMAVLLGICMIIIMILCIAGFGVAFALRGLGQILQIKAV